MTGSFTFSKQQFVMLRPFSWIWKKCCIYSTQICTYFLLIYPLKYDMLVRIQWKTAICCIQIPPPIFNPTFQLLRLCFVILRDLEAPASAPSLSSLDTTYTRCPNHTSTDLRVVNFLFPSRNKLLFFSYHENMREKLSLLHFLGLWKLGHLLQSRALQFPFLARKKSGARCNWGCRRME